MALPAHVPLAVATRGDTVECVHYGSIAVADAKGKILWSVGDAHAPVFGRSALKPFQAMPLLAHPEAGKYQFTAREIAILCASHSGEPRHADAVLGVLGKAGCHLRDLQCGVHPPLYLEALEQRPHAEDIYTPVHHNCSGKHAGMLALARLLQAPTATYLESQHPVQQAIRGCVAHFTGVPAADLAAGVDGCSAPNYAVPLSALAAAYARLGDPAPDACYGDAPARVYDAMTRHPELVSGLKRFDLALTHTGHGEWISKGGAEGVQCLSVRRHGFGVAIKIADGATRAAQTATVETLRQLELLPKPEDTPLRDYRRLSLLNVRGIQTGEVYPVYVLRRDAG
ncbi:MAG TPA: asparaginase [Gammaproteobacteria bacterium]|nr:asparaginase [Gammaproteobacteria bacterium]